MIVKNLKNYKNRFYSLLESKMGDVKPLINEDDYQGQSGASESDLQKIVERVLLESEYNPKNLKFGDRGPDVVKLQKRLVRDKFLVMPIGVKYGYFGKLTKAALAKAEGKTTKSDKDQKQTSKDPTDIKSYPECVRQFGKPVKNTTTGQVYIKGDRFYEGYLFYNNGTYYAIKTKKQGNYSCIDGKLQLDIAAKGVDNQTKKSGQYQYSPRIDAEMQHIKNRGFDDKPFIIYDPRENLLYFFDVGGKLIKYTSVVDGADSQKTLADSKGFTYNDWCKVSGLKDTPHLCTDPKTNTKKDPTYSILKTLKSRFIPKGIYTITGLEYHKGYAGGDANTYRLKPLTLDGTITSAMQSKAVSPAIHGIPNISERLKASKDLESKLKSDISGGKVPPEYLNDINAILMANQSYGCVGVPASFVDDPKVKTLIQQYKTGIRVFAMGESTQDYLVKNDQDQSKNNVA